MFKDNDEKLKYLYALIKLNHCYLYTLLTFNFQSILKDGGNALTIQSKYTSAPSLIPSAFNDEPNAIRVSGESKMMSLTKINSLKEDNTYYFFNIITTDNLQFIFNCQPVSKTSSLT